MTAEPMGDDELITLAQHRFEQADRAGASHDDCQQLRDIFPALLQRLREKTEITRDLVEIPMLDLAQPGAYEWTMAASKSGPAVERP